LGFVALFYLYVLFVYRSRHHPMEHSTFTCTVGRTYFDLLRSSPGTSHTLLWAVRFSYRNVIDFKTKTKLPC